MSHHRITEGERNQIYALNQAGLGNNAIARQIKRDKGTVSREVARNSGGRGYRPKQAQEKADERAKRPGARRLTGEVKADIAGKMALGWTPGMISGRARLEGRPRVCKETVYGHIYADAKAGGTLWTLLPRARRKRRRRCPRPGGRGRGIIPGRRDIGGRPAEAEGRQSVGHWEGDLVNGARGTGNLLTLVERKVRFALVGRTAGKEAGEVGEAAVAQFLRVPAKARGSATFDNGKEFAFHALIAERAGIDVYFARPYRSCDRGTNENRNGQVRRLYPKGSPFDGIGEAEIARIESFLNDRPLRCLGWRTPREEMEAFLAV